MHSLGFEIFDCDGKTIEAQARAFRSAKAIVAIHGASLTNLGYTTTSCQFLLELCPIEQLNPCYFWLAETLGISYSALVYENSEIQINDLDHRVRLLQTEYRKTDHTP